MHKYILMQIKLKNLFYIVFALALSGCGLFGDRVDETKNFTAAKLYADAKEELTSGSYERAVQLFERLESRLCP